MYYYIKNIFGDVTHICNHLGTIVGKYDYDAYGNSTITLDSYGIAIFNAIRYRGYYYDSETKLYYLNSRYYDPYTGRFISPDSYEYLEPTAYAGLNLYAYALNNPVMYSDPSGHFVISLLVSIAVSTIIGGVVAAATGQNVLTGMFVGAAVGLLIAAGGAGVGLLATQAGTAWGAGAAFAVSFFGNAAVGAGVGALSSAGLQAGNYYANNGTLSGFNLDWSAVGKSALIGGAIGGITGAINFGFMKLSNAHSSLVTSTARDISLNGGSFAVLKSADLAFYINSALVNEGLLGLIIGLPAWWLGTYWR